MLLADWLDGVRRRLSFRWLKRRSRLARTRQRQRLDLAGWHLPAYVDVLEERVLLSSFALGTETLVNATISGDQKFSAQTDRNFTTTPDGGAFIAWTSTTQAASVATASTSSSTSSTSTGQSILARFVDATGNPVGSDIQVSSAPCQSAGNAVVGVAGPGRYVIVWEATGNSLDKNGAGIFARLYASNGTPLSNEFRVAQTTSRDQKGPSVVVLNPTTFAIAWSGSGSGKSTGVYVRLFNTSGVAQTNEIRVPSTTKGGQQDATIMSMPGGFLVAWSGTGTGDTAGVFVRRFDTSGKPIGNEFLVNSSIAGTQVHPAIAVSPSAGIVIAWEGTGCSLDGSGAGVYARRFSLTGAPLGNEFLVSDVTNGDQKDPSIAWLSDGGFAVTWSGNGTGDSDGVFVREFQANGTPRGPSQRVNTTIAGSQAFPAIRVRGTGYLIDWSGNGIGDSSGVFLQAFDSGDKVAPSVTARLVNDSGISSNDRLTNDPTVTGTAADNIGVTILEAAFDQGSGNPIYQNITNKLSNGAYTLTSADLFGLLAGGQNPFALALPRLPDGNYNLLVRSRDKAGNISPLATLSFTLDTTAPAAPTVDLPDESDSGESPTDNLTNLTSFTLTGGAESGALVKLTRNGESAGQTAANSPWQIPQSGLSDGSYVYTATAQDLAGNISHPSAPLTVVVDTLISAPTAALQNDTGASNSDRVTNDPTIQGTAADPHGIALLEGAIIGGIQPAAIGGLQLVSFQNITNRLVNGTYILTAGDLAALNGGTLPDGDYLFSVRSRDQAGNISEITTLSFTLDTTPPSLSLDLDPESDTDFPSDRSTSLHTVSLIGTTEPGLRVTLAPPGTQQTASGVGSYRFDNVSLVAGQNPFTVSATDAAGNLGSFSTAITRTECEFANLNDWVVSQTGGGENPGTVTAGNCIVTLREGDSFNVTLSRTFLVDAAHPTISFTYEDPQFDFTDPSFINDAFEVALLDADGNPLIPAFTPSRDAFFNITEGLAAALGTLSTTVGHSVTLDLSAIPVGTQATLAFRLVNNDSDQQTTVRIIDADVPPAVSSAAVQQNASMLPLSPLAPLNSLSLEYSSTGNVEQVTSANVGSHASTSATIAGFDVTLLATVSLPYGLAIAPVGSAFGDDVFVTSADLNDETTTPDLIYRISKDGNVTLFAMLLPEADPVDLAFPPAGSSYGDFLYVVANNRDGDQPTDFGGAIERIDSSGNWIDFTSLTTPPSNAPQPTLTALGEPDGFAFAPGGAFGTDLYVANSTDYPSDIVRVLPDGSVTPFIDDGSFDYFGRSGLLAIDLAFGPGGAFGTDLYFLDHNPGVEGIRIADPSGNVSDPFVRFSSITGSMAFGPSGPFGGSLYAFASDSAGTGLYRIGPDGSKSMFLPDVSGQVTFSADGLTMYVSDVSHNAIYKITPGSQPSIFVDNPSPGTVYSPGTTVLVAGHVEPDNPAVPVTLVTANGGPVDALDAAGHFFARVPILPGSNGVQFMATDALGHQATTTFSLWGVDHKGASYDLSQFVDVSASFAVDYARTSFDDAGRTLYADSAVHNLGQYPANIPLLVGVKNISDPSVFPLDTAGTLPDGTPYYDFTGLVTGNSLNPGEQTGMLSLSFFNPQRSQFTYELVFYGQPNHAPTFTTVPILEALAGKPYQYDADAADLDGDAVRFSLVTGPSGMTINAKTGLVSWSPNEADLGTHHVTIGVTDGRGGSAQQHYVLSAIIAPPNRPPIITSTPLEHGNVGVQYSYDVNAIDPDFDPIRYALLNAPAGMTIDNTTGLISWTPTVQDFKEAAQDPTLGVAPGFLIESFASGLILPYQIDIDSLGNLYVASGGSNAKPYRIERSDHTFEVLGSSTIPDPDSVLIDESGAISGTPGTLIVGSAGSLFTINPDGTVTEIAGPSSLIDNAEGMHLDSRGRVIFSRWLPNSGIVAYNGHEVTTLFSAPSAYSTAIDGEDHIYLSGNTGSISKYDLSGDLLDSAYVTGLRGDSYLAVATGGIWGTDLYIAEHVSDGTSSIWRIGSDKQRHLIASHMPFIASIAFSPDGAMYLSDYDNGRILQMAPDRHTLELSNGEFRVKVAASDGRGGVATQSFTICVDQSPGNHAPLIVSQPPIHLDLDEFVAGFQNDVVFTVPGVPGQAVEATFDWTYRNASYNNEFGIYHVSDASGRVNGLSPGEAGYARAALSEQNSRTIFQSGQGAGATTRITLYAGEVYAFYLIQNSSVTNLRASNPDDLLSQSPLAFFSLPSANPDGAFDHLFAGAVTAQGLTQFFWEDLTFGGDQSFNDVVFTIDLALLPGAHKPFEYQVQSIDSDGDPLHYSLLAAPPDAAIDSQSGLLTWLPSAGVFDFTVRVEDGRGGFDEQSFTIDVTQGSGEIHGTVFDDLSGNALRDLGRMFVTTTGGDGGSNNAVLLFDGQTGAPLDVSTYGHLAHPSDATIGPDGNLYVVGYLTNNIVRFNGTTGAFIDEFVTSVGNPFDVVFGPDGNLYVSSAATNTVERFDGTTGTYLGTFASGSGLVTPVGITFGPDGNLYVANFGGSKQSPNPGYVLRFDGVTGNFKDVFVSAANSGGLKEPAYLTFGPDGDLYVGDYGFTFGHPTVRKFDGSTGAPLGEFISGGPAISRVYGLTFGPDGNLFVATVFNSTVVRYDGVTGAFIDEFVPSGTPALVQSLSPIFGPEFEPGLAGWTIYLDQNQNGRRDPGEQSTFTDTDGNYAFANLPADIYYVREEPQSGWSQTAPAAGVYVVTVGASQTITGIDFGNQQTGDASNRSPTINSLAPTEAVTGGLYRYDVVASDPDGDPLTFDLPTAPAGMTVHPDLGILVWRPTAEQVGTFPVVLRTQDRHGGFALQSFQLTVSLANNWPVITSTPGGPATAGLPFQYQVLAQDADGDPITYSLVDPNNTGAKIDPNTGILTWNPNANQVGPHHAITVIATDNRNGAAFQSIDIAVEATSTNDPPIVSFVPRLTAQLGIPWVALVDAFDPNGDPLSFSLVTKPDGMKIDGLGQITWTPTPAQLGPQNAQLKVSDGRGGDILRNFVVTVGTQDTNHAPIVVSTPKLHALEGALYTLDLKGFDEDNDPFTWSLVTAPRGMSIDPSRGTIRWTPDDDQLGDNEVVVKIRDLRGATSTQAFTIDMTCVNLAPVITSVPLTEAAVNGGYFYAVRATDPESDTLTFTLLSTPAKGMTLDPETGLLRWTPTAEFANTTRQIVIQVDDRNGNLATQSFAVQVSATAKNQPPVIVSTPAFKATIDRPYAYDVNANDPENGVLKYSLNAQDHPTNMTIDPNSGVISWNPVASDAGPHLVTVEVRDSADAVAVQSFVLVASANVAPVIDSNPSTTATVGAVYRYDVRAHDADGDPLSYLLTVYPDDMTIDGLGRLRWNVPADFPTGSPVPVEIAVSDGVGHTVSQSFAIVLKADTVAPTVRLATSATLIDDQGRYVVDLGGQSLFQVQASDNVGVVSRTLTVDGVPLPLDALGNATWPVDRAGLVHVVATAKDAAGNIGTATLDLRVRDPNDANAPVVEITSPDPALADNVVTYLTNVVGRIHDDNLLLWHLDYALASAVDLNNLPAADPDWHTITSGTTNIDTDALLGVFDPTLLMNDQYVIRLYAEDTNGLINTRGVLVSVQGNAKLGNFRLEFTDLQIPLAGIPITITRVYDTLQASQQGDFGYGWTLGMADAQIRETIPDNGGDFFTQFPFKDGTRVYLTGPDGQRIGFTFQPDLKGSFFGVLARPKFVPDPGVYAQLEDAETSDFSLFRTADGTYHGFMGIGNYNPSNYILTTEDGLKYQYGQTAGLEKVTDRNGNTLTFTSGGIFSSTGVNVLFQRDGQGRIIQITDPDGKSLNYKYDAQGNLVSFADQLGNTTTHSYKNSPTHYLDTITDPLGRPVARANYDAQGRLVGVTNGPGNHSQQAFDSTNFTGTFTDANGNITLYVYDARGNVISKTDPEGGVTLYEYGDLANPDKETKVTDPNGHATRYAYDSRGNVIKTIDALGGVTLSTYNAANRVTSTTGALGHTVTYAYDADGNVIQVVDPSGATRTATRDDRGRITSVTDALANTTQMLYDAGCPCGSPDDVINPDGTTRHYEKNNFGQTTQLIDENGHKTDYVYDDRGLLLSTTDANGAKTTFEYDALGNRTLVRDPDGNVTTFDYDTSRHVIKETDPLGHVTRYEYDPAGNLITKIDRDSRVTRFKYDKNNRLILETWYDASNTLIRTITNTYDAMGNRLSVSDPDATLSFTYDALNRVATATTVMPGLSPFTLTYHYDPVGNVVSIVDNTGVEVDSKYDPRQLLTQLTWQGGGIDPVRVNFAYDANGQQTQINRYTDLAGTQLSLATAITHDVRALTASMTYTNASNTVLAHFGYTYDALGLVKTFQDGSQTVAYQYDPTGQLLGADYADNSVQPDESYQYDTNGNRTQKTVLGEHHVYQTGTGNQLLSDGAFNYAYDNEGNTIRKTEIATGAVTTFEYDNRNRLIHVNQVAGDGTVVSDVQYRYDPLGRRIAAVTNGQETVTVYNGVNVWADLDSAGNNEARYLLGNKVDALVARQVQGVGMSWYCTDAAGSIRVVASAAGAVLNRNTYDTFGNIVLQSNPAAGDRFMFVGREFDPAIGQYNFRARQFDAIAGRFSTRDPLGLSQSDFNLYRFLMNSPGNAADPSGRDLYWYALKGFALGTMFGAIRGLIERPVDCPGLSDDGDRLASAIVGGIVQGGIGLGLGVVGSGTLGLLGLAFAIPETFVTLPVVGYQIGPGRTAGAALISWLWLGHPEDLAPDVIKNGVCELLEAELPHNAS